MRFDSSDRAGLNIGPQVKIANLKRSQTIGWLRYPTMRVIRRPLTREMQTTPSASSQSDLSQRRNSATAQSGNLSGWRIGSRS